jgi:hypothetical protein
MMLNAETKAQTIKKIKYLVCFQMSHLKDRVASMLSPNNLIAIRQTNKCLLLQMISNKETIKEKAEERIKD